MTINVVLFTSVYFKFILVKYAILYIVILVI